MDIYLGTTPVDGNHEKIVGYYQENNHMNSISGDDKDHLLQKMRARFKSEEVTFYSKDIEYFKKLNPKPNLLDDSQLADIINSYKETKYKVIRDH